MKIESTRKAFLYLAAIFMVGLVIGGVAGLTIALVWKFKVPSLPQFEAKVYESFKEKLELKPEQESEVKAAVHDMMLQIGDAFKNLGTTSSNALVKCQIRLEPALNPKQRGTLSNIVAEHFQKSNPDLKTDK
jgi:hypothetical protein